MSNCRWILCALAVGFSAIIATEIASFAKEIVLDGDTPATVYVTSARAEIRSGPAEEYYPTHRPPLNATMLAYHRTQGGWLAIRPPSGSFSWVPAAKAYLLPGGKVIEVTEAETVSWIGTQLGTAKHYRWQVQLNIGEQLNVLGEKNMSDADGNDELWYKIAPPDGEYRWIHENDVSLHPVEAPLDHAEPERIADEKNVRALKRNTATIASSSTTSTKHSEALVNESATHGSRRANERVETANYQDDIFDDTEVYDMQPVPQVRAPVQMAPTANRWDGWHAWDLDDNGMRLTLLEKLMGGSKSAPRTDPQAADPFDLRMGSPVRPGRMTPQQFQIIQEQRVTSADMGGVGMGRAGIPPNSLAAQQRPWRDPNTLRQERLARSAVDGNLSRTAPNIIQSIRENVQSLRKSIGSTARGTPDKAFASEQDFEDEWGQVDDLDIPPIRPFGDTDGSKRLAERSEAPEPANDKPTTQWYGIGSDRAERRAPVPVSSDFAPAARSPSVRAAEDSRSPEIDQLKVALSEMVAGPPSLWNLERLSHRAKHLIEHGADPIERGQARLLLERIQEFETHAERTAFAAPGVIRSSYSEGSPGIHGGESTQMVTAGYRRRTEQPASEFPAPQTSATNPPVSQPYDATGWLVPVHATTSGQPSHAITDDSGHIVAYVTSRTGLDLDSYLNQPVGIIGLRGYLPHLQTSHIQAQRVVFLR